MSLAMKLLLCNNFFSDKVLLSWKGVLKEGEKFYPLGKLLNIKK